MPGPTDPIDNSVPAEDSFLELLAETLENLDRPARGQFLQRFFSTIAHLELTEAASLERWDQILARQRELREESGKPVSLKRAIVDVLASSSLLRVPVLIEYDELKKLEISAATDSLTELLQPPLLRRPVRQGIESRLALQPEPGDRDVGPAPIQGSQRSLRTPARRRPAADGRGHAAKFVANF